MRTINDFFFFSGGGALDPPAAGKKDRDKMGVGPKICGVATADGQTHNSDRSEGRVGGEVAFMHSRNAMFVGWSS